MLRDVARHFEMRWLVENRAIKLAEARKGGKMLERLLTVSKVYASGISEMLSGGSPRPFTAGGARGRNREGEMGRFYKGGWEWEWGGEWPVSGNRVIGTRTEAE